MATCRISQRQRCCALVLLVLLLSACGAERPSRGSPAIVTRQADSLVATSRDGSEVWFTLAREGKGADGTSCVERGLEIRRGGTRIQVPLLYTGTAPQILDQSTMRAELWNHCRPVGTYLVDLRTGRPTRERSEST